MPVKSNPGQQGQKSSLWGNMFGHLPVSGLAIISVSMWKGNESCLSNSLSTLVWGSGPPSHCLLVWKEGLRPLESGGLFAQPNYLSAPFYGVVKAVWLRVLLNDTWIKACSYMQLEGTEQGIIVGSSVKPGFHRSVGMCEGRQGLQNVWMCEYVAICMSVMC